MSALVTFERDLDLSAIDRADLAVGTKRQYKRVLRGCAAAGVSLWDYRELVEYAAGLRPSARAYLKAGIRILAGDLAGQLKAGAVPDNLPVVSAALLRLDALTSAVKVEKPAGERVHTWLTSDQVKALLSTCGDDLQGWRDWIVLSLMLGAGLRRLEVVAIRIANMVCLPVPGGDRYALQLRGKGDKSRVVPIAAGMAARLRSWSDRIGGGYLARRLNRSGGLGPSLSAVAVYDIVKAHGAQIGKPDLAPHDLRRTYAQLGYQAGIPVTQISSLLGHASIVTTQRYLNLSLNFVHTVSDEIPLDFGLGVRV